MTDNEEQKEDDTEESIVEMTDEKMVLIINDLQDWSYNVRAYHAKALKDKISDYLQFNDSGQVAEYHKNNEYDRMIKKYFLKKGREQESFYLKKVKTIE